jgi:hypothetical protein
MNRWDEVEGQPYAGHEVAMSASAEQRRSEPVEVCGHTGHEVGNLLENLLTCDTATWRIPCHLIVEARHVAMPGRLPDPMVFSQSAEECHNWHLEFKPVPKSHNPLRTGRPL